MKTKELYEKDTKSLLKLSADAKAQIVKDRFKIAAKEMTKVSEISKSKKIIARINTILSQRAISELENSDKDSSSSERSEKKQQRSKK